MNRRCTGVLLKPLYLGLIVAQAVYVFYFWVELVHLLEAVFGSSEALQALINGIGYKTDVQITKLNETIIMLVVLGLIDVVMISNLLIMVIVGGYETFAGRMNLESHPDQPEWLHHVNASVLKVKLSTAIIGISSIHLLKTFINAANYDVQVLMWQAIIHIAFLLSALAIATTDRLMSHSAPVAHWSHHFSTPILGYDAPQQITRHHFCLHLSPFGGEPKVCTILVQFSLG